MKVLDLFSGIGGFSLGLERAGMETVAFCEIDPYCKKVLKKHWPHIEIFNDIRTLDGKQFRGTIDVICGGYPCQPFSVAGSQLGEEDERHLWPEMFRIIQDVRPRWVICENVYGHVKLGLDTVISSLADEGYTVTTFIIPACALGARHKRDRLWIVGYSEHDGSPAAKVTGSVDQASNNDAKRAHDASESTGASERRDNEVVENSDSSRVGSRYRSEQAGEINKLSRSSETLADSLRQQIVGIDKSGFQPESTGSREVMADTDVTGQQEFDPTAISSGEGLNPGCFGGQGNYWAVEPGICRVVDGVPNRIHRLKGLGNAVVPQIPEMIGKAIMEIEKNGSI